MATELYIKRTPGGLIPADAHSADLMEDLPMGKEIKAVCTVAGCDSPKNTKGMCKKHYARWKRYGDPNFTKYAPHGEPLRFLNRAVNSDTDECVIWPYHVNSWGYGTVVYKGKSIGAHRLSLILSEGEPPTKKHEAAHAPIICNNRACINPNHLRWATRKENCQDQFLDKTDRQGERSSTAKLTRHDVLAIRADKRKDKVLAEIYGVTECTISYARKRKTWKHI